MRLYQCSHICMKFFPGCNYNFLHILSYYCCTLNRGFRFLIISPCMPYAPIPKFCNKVDIVKIMAMVSLLNKWMNIIILVSCPISDLISIQLYSLYLTQFKFWLDEGYRFINTYLYIPLYVYPSPCTSPPCGRWWCKGVVCS